MWDILLILDGFDIVLQLYNLYCVDGGHEWSVDFMILCRVCFTKEVVKFILYRIIVDNYAEKKSFMDVLNAFLTNKLVLMRLR